MFDINTKSFTIYGQIHLHIGHRQSMFLWICGSSNTALQLSDSNYACSGRLKTKYSLFNEGQDIKKDEEEKEDEPEQERFYGVFNYI